MTKNPPTEKKPVAQAVRAAIAGTVETLMLRPDRIAPSPTNPRKTFPEGSLLDLASSMKHDGQVQAITVRPISVDAMLKFNKDHPDFDEATGTRPDYELIVGERRWRAASMADLELRAEVRELSDLEVLRIQIIENLHREEVHPLEEAEGYEYLLKHSAEQVSIDQVADEVGKSRSYIHKRMRLTALCPAAREKFYAGGFDASTALLIARLPTPGLQLSAIKDIVEMAKYHGGESPSYREIRNRLASRYQLLLSRATFDITVDNLVQGCSSCVACPKRTGNQPLLFEDVDNSDICTDPDCFASKKKAGIAAVIAQARAEGLDVVEGEETKLMKPERWSSPQGYTALAEVAYDEEAEVEGDPREVTYAHLLAKAGKKAPKPFLLVDPHRPEDVPEKYITDREAEQLAKKFAPKEALEVASSNRGSPAEQAAWKTEQRASAVSHHYRQQLLAALVEKADEPRTAADLILIVFALAGDELSDEFLEAIGVEVPEGDQARDFDHEQAMFDALKQLTGEDLSTIVYRLALGDLESGGYGTTVPPTIALELAADRHKINLAGLRKKAEALADKGDGEDDESDD